MPRSLRKELDSLMKAQVEQLDLWHKTAKDGADPTEAILLLMQLLGIQRDAMLRLAEEVDLLAGRANN